VCPPMLDFWFDFASTYSYPAAMRIRRLADEAGIAVRFRPFLLGPIFKTQGWTTSPFNLFTAKGQNMWRDLERICADAGLPFRRPEPFPQNSVLAARVALVGLAERGAKRSVLRYSKRNLAKAAQSPMPMLLPTSFCALTLRPRKRWRRQHRTITSSDCVHRPKRRSVWVYSAHRLLLPQMASCSGVMTDWSAPCCG